MVYSYDDINPDDYIRSKSQAKREMTALQELGEKLVELNDNQLAQIPVEPKLLEAPDGSPRSAAAASAIHRQADAHHGSCGDSTGL